MTLRAEISAPLARREETAREELPPVEGCGYQDPSFDALGAWHAKHKAGANTKASQGALMPGVEAMPNWQSFVGWADAKPKVKAQAASRAEPAAQPSVASAPVAKAPAADTQDPVHREPPSDESTLNLVDLDAAAVIEAAAASVPDEPRPRTSPFAPPPQTDQSTGSTLVFRLDEPSASLEPEVEPDVVQKKGAAPPATGGELAPKLAHVRPVAHPGRLPAGFALSPSEKAVLRLCDGMRTTTDVLSAQSELGAEALTAFLKRCARVKLVTFKR